MNILEEITTKIRLEEQEKWNKFNIDKIEIVSDNLPRIPHKIEDDFLIIAEMKKASPSAGIIIEEYNVLDIADSYAKANIKAFSILTEKNYFKGKLEDLRSVRDKYQDKILLRKDFIIHPFQILEAYNNGADMILLIVALLDNKSLIQLYNIASKLRLNILVEIHNKNELDRILDIDLDNIIIGINNRDLKTLKVDIENSFRLKEYIPSNYKVIAESGFSTSNDIIRLKNSNFAGILIGHSILTKQNKVQFLQELQR